MARPATETEPAKPRGKIITDPELVAMNRINRILSTLDEKPRIRVVEWLKAKVEFPILPNDGKE